MNCSFKSSKNYVFKFLRNCTTVRALTNYLCILWIALNAWSISPMIKLRQNFITALLVGASQFSKPSKSRIKIFSITIFCKTSLLWLIISTKLHNSGFILKTLFLFGVKKLKLKNTFSNNNCYLILLEGFCLQGKSCQSSQT